MTRRKQNANLRCLVGLCLSGLALIAGFSATAQIAEYRFDSDLSDDIAGRDGGYFELGISSTNPPTFVPGSVGNAVVVDHTQGIQLPTGVSDQFDTQTSLEIELEFVVTEIGDGRGIQWLLTMMDYAGFNGPGMSLVVIHDPFSQMDDYELRFTYADGGFDQGVPNHPGHEENTLGQFNEGDQVSLRLVIDFAQRTWSSLANSTFSSGRFDTRYDFQTIASTAKSANPWVNWALDHESNISFEPDIYTATVRYDHLRFFSPRRVGDAGTLTDALAAMTDHVDGTNPLSESEREVALANIFLNLNGNLFNHLSDILAYTTAYEASHAPAFSDRTEVPIANLASETRALLFLQQAIHDDVFTPSNLHLVPNLAFEAADIFPGTVAPSAPRLNGETVTIDGTYSRITGAPVVNDLAPAKRPTGFYAPPGEQIAITIPAGLTQAGLEVLVGAHDSDLSSRIAINRFVRIAKTFPLDTTTTLVANPFGGGIYIKVPEGSALGSFDVTIDGAVKAPYLSTRQGMATGVSQWQAELLAENVAWVDMESDKYMMTVPLHHVAPITDPEALMDGLDAIMDAYNYVGGRPPARNRAAYFLLDSMLPGPAYGTGYPQVIGDRGAPYGPLGQTEYIPTIILQPDFHLLTGYAITLHERGHGELHPTLPNEVESIVHLPASYIHGELYGLGIDVGFQYSAFEKLTMDEATIDWMISGNFRSNQPMGCDPIMDELICDEIRYQHRGHAKFVELADLFGWSAVHGMNKVFYDEWNAMANPTYVITPDDIIEAAATATGVNVAPLFHFWGLPPSAALATQLEMLPQSPVIRDRLLQYRALVPQNATEFQPWYTAIRAKKDPVHSDRYDTVLATYDSEGYGEAMQGQVDLLIEIYFSKIFANGFESSSP